MNTCPFSHSLHDTDARRGECGHLWPFSEARIARLCVAAPTIAKQRRHTTWTIASLIGIRPKSALVSSAFLTSY
jgi:hypothetical protein